MINLSTNPQSPLNGRSQAVVGAVAKVPSKLYKLGSTLVGNAEKIPLNAATIPMDGNRKSGLT